MDDIVEQLKFFAALGVTHLNVDGKLASAVPRPRRRTVPPELTPPPVPKPSAAPVSRTSAATVSKPSPPPVQTAIPTVAGPQVPPVDSLDEIREIIGDCQRCKLCKGRKNIVFGVGNPRADLMFVGEGPGADEDEQGIPFVGKAGQLLTRIIETMFGIQRDDVYIANIVKCRPPENRDPEPDEIEQCETFLYQQIEVVQPKVIVALGRCAAQTLLRSKTSITALRGKFFDYRGRLLMPTFHPSYLLRSPSKKREVFWDMKAVRARLEELGTSYDFSDIPPVSK